VRKYFFEGAGGRPEEGQEKKESKWGVAKREKQGSIAEHASGGMANIGRNCGGGSRHGRSTGKRTVGGGVERRVRWKGNSWRTERFEGGCVRNEFAGGWGLPYTLHVTIFLGGSRRRAERLNVQKRKEEENKCSGAAEVTLLFCRVGEFAKECVYAMRRKDRIEGDWGQEKR